MERLENNFKTKVNSLVMFDNYYNSFVKPVKEKKNMHLWGYEEESQIIEQAENSQVEEAWLNESYTALLDAMDEQSN
jgi:hypothetical protein